MTARFERFWDAHFEPEPFADKHVVIVLPDATRPLPLEAMLAPLLTRIVGLTRSLTLLVAPGLHRPLTPLEREPYQRLGTLFGATLLEHDAHDASQCAQAGMLFGQRAMLNAHVLGAECVVCVGVIEPHQYAGYSGGCKAVSIGCASHHTIATMHGLRLLADSGARPGHLQGNLFRLAMHKVCEPLLPRMFGFQVAGDWTGFGAVEDVFERGAAHVAKTAFQTHEKAYPWVHVSVPASKSDSFYQASRAATYLALVPRSVVAPGGVILVEAACGEGIGLGEGEAACGRAMAKGVEALRQDLLPGGGNTRIEGGAQRAYVLAIALESCQIALVGAARVMPEVHAMGISQWETLESALWGLGLAPTQGLSVSNPFETIPVLGA